MANLRQHSDYLDGEWRALRAAPLSMRKATLVAALVDAYVDRLFEADREAEDILEYRSGIAKRSPALGQIMALAAGRTKLVTEAVEVPIANYGALAVEDFMVSLYNGHSVQRLRLNGADMLEILAEAMDALDGL